MRFKKLRLLVGITLILFIFIVSNIIFFGRLVDKTSFVQMNNQAQNLSLIDPKNIYPPEILVKNNSGQLIENVQNTTKTSTVEQPTPPVVEPTPPPEPVIIHTTRRTHAS